MTDEERISGVDGLTLRDWFAGQALAGLLAAQVEYGHAALNAYNFADTMLNERDKRNPCLDDDEILDEAQNQDKAEADGP